jgi:CheY-like chemotaxis protein
MPSINLPPGGEDGADRMRPTLIPFSAGRKTMPINVAPPSLNGCRILVVEDEPLVSMMIEDVLTTSGGGVVGPALTAKEALELLEREAVHCAVLDVKLMEGSSLPVAEALNARAIPFLIVTGVDQKTVPIAYHGAPVLLKVFMPTN